MVSGFLKSSSHNLRYVGIDSLARVVRINAKYAAEHQLAVIDCLEDPDDTLKKKTLELLFKMTKPSNVEVRARPEPFSPSPQSIPARGWVLDAHAWSLKQLKYSLVCNGAPAQGLCPAWMGAGCLRAPYPQIAR
jgi:hypothetical protein